MSRLKIAIADNDGGYLEKLVDFILSNYSKRFQVYSFSNKDVFQGFMNKEAQEIDILLLSKDMILENIYEQNEAVKILLSDGRTPLENKELKVINKFQDGNKLVGDILNIFSECSKDEYNIEYGNKGAKVVTVFSPSGGSGKTMLSLLLGIRSVLKNKKVFYLNLENISSITGLLNTEKERSISNMFYFIKEKNKNIPLKIEGLKCVDENTKLHYFSNPESVMDFEELSSEDIYDLIEGLKANAQYDMILIDTSSVLDKINRSVFEKSDKVIVVVPHEQLAYYKTDLLEKEIDILSKKLGIDIFDKIMIVLNKYNPHSSFNSETITIDKNNIVEKIPYMQEFKAVNSINDIAEIGKILQKTLDKIFDLIYKE